ncbi:chemotaxis [Tupanvirus deep ocean]|uniref:Chemotaxis n=2 Tax=Tupanvirus TaxID=2094720 RepID=A0AC62AA46_9VIRU|nr:chemotaxis [Tupanvirus deep ocean]QKU34548.1 chemotaxis [Tupanvirus deep ocean]
MSDINEFTDPNARRVSGPVNVIRLEGEIHGIPKVLYLFMDYHIPVSDQTQCENVFSEDVQKYFINNFYRLNEGSNVYDFFVEIYPSELADDKYRKGSRGKDIKEKYIEEVVKMFRKIFRYDPKRNRIQVNKLFKNVRLHYLDIRDYYKHSIADQVSEMTRIAHRFINADYIDPKGLDKIISLMQLMKDHMEYISSVLGRRANKISQIKPKIIKQNNRSDLDTQAIEYLANKIKKMYNHTDVKNAMLDLIDLTIDNFNLTMNEIDDATRRFINYSNTIQNTGNKLVKDENTSYIYSYGLTSYTTREMMIDILNTVERLLDERFIEFFARFTDIYFLRRFLDKDYITNGIVYSGALHSNTYIYFLIKIFNFRITHASYSKIKDLNKLTNEIKKRSLMSVQELILPETLNQCSDLDSFPEEFM